jgi:hypothetical protein
LPFLSVENDGFGKEVVADLFGNAQWPGEQGKVEKLSIERGNLCFFVMKTEDAP